MYPEIFERLMKGVEGIGENWQVVVRQEGVHDILEFCMELTDGVGRSTVEARFKPT